MEGDNKPSYCLGLRCGHWLTDAGCGGVRGEAGSISSEGKSQVHGEKSLPQFPEAPVGGRIRCELFLGTAYTGSGCRSCESTAVEGTGAPLHLDFLQMGEETERATQI